MKCINCDLDGEGKFCNECGTKYISSDELLHLTLDKVKTLENEIQKLKKQKPIINQKIGINDKSKNKLKKIKILMKKEGISFGLAYKQLFGRYPSGSSYERYKSEYNLTKYKHKIKKPKLINQDPRAKRMKFIGSRTIWFINNYKWNRQKAWHQASEEWNNQRGLGKVTNGGTINKKIEQKTEETYHKTFDWEELNVNNIEELKGSIENALVTNHKVTSKDVSHLITSTEWTYNICPIILRNQKKILTALGLKRNLIYDGFGVLELK